MKDKIDEPGAEQGAEAENHTADLVQAAKDAGAVPVIESLDIARTDPETEKAFAMAPDTKDILGTGKIDFHKELPQVQFAMLVGHTFLLTDIKMVEGWDGIFGTSNFHLIALQLKDGRRCTCLAGGQAIYKQLRGIQAQVVARRARYPIKVKLTQQPGGQGLYYLFD